MAALGALGLRGVRRHAANSAALLRDRRTWYDWVRPGLLLYGIVPPPLAASLDLRPALSLTSRIVAVKGLRPGEGTGLRSAAGAPTGPARSRSFRPATPTDSTRDCRAAAPSSSAAVGMPIVGSVCMDMLMVDVTGLDVDPGDEVVFIGRQGGARSTAREMAAAIGAIPWEIVCRLGARIERRYEIKLEVRSSEVRSYWALAVDDLSVTCQRSAACERPWSASR